MKRNARIISQAQAHGSIKLKIRGLGAWGLWGFQVGLQLMFHNPCMSRFQDRRTEMVWVSNWSIVVLFI